VFLKISSLTICVTVWIYKHHFISLFLLWWFLWLIFIPKVVFPQVNVFEALPARGWRKKVYHSWVFQWSPKAALRCSWTGELMKKHGRCNHKLLYYNKGLLRIRWFLPKDQRSTSSSQSVFNIQMAVYSEWAPLHQNEYSNEALALRKHSYYRLTQYTLACIQERWIPHEPWPYLSHIVWWQFSSFILRTS
jgi:hypothetical protein